MAEIVKSVKKPVRKLTVYRDKDGKTEKEVITLKRGDVIVACADYLLYGDVVDGDIDKCVVAHHDHVNIFDYEDVTGLLGLDSEYSAEAYGVHIIKRNGEKIEVSGNVITYRDKRNKFTYRKSRGMASFLIID
jgi:hypothetical protein